MRNVSQAPEKNGVEANWRRNSRCNFRFHLAIKRIDKERLGLNPVLVSRWWSQRQAWCRKLGREQAERVSRESRAWV